MTERVTYADAIPGIVSYTQYGPWFLSAKKFETIVSLKSLLEDYHDKLIRCNDNVHAFAEGIAQPNEIIASADTPTFVYQAVDFDGMPCHFLFNMAIAHAFCLDNEEQVAKILSLKFLANPFQLAGHTWERHPRSLGIQVVRLTPRPPRTKPSIDHVMHTPSPPKKKKKKKSSIFSFLSRTKTIRGGNRQRHLRKKKTTRGSNRASATRRRAHCAFSCSCSSSFASLHHSHRL